MHNPTNESNTHKIFSLGVNKSTTFYGYIKIGKLFDLKNHKKDHKK